MATLETQYKNWLKENEPIEYSEWLERFSEIRNLDKLKNKMESKMTAIKWMVTELESYGDTHVCKITWEDLDSLFEQALEMEKEQIILANEDCSTNELGEFISGEQYYNETYGK
jgi:hypothetical protein